VLFRSDEIVRHRPDLKSVKWVQQSLQDLETAHKALGKEKLSVGFVGQSKAGKSSTINRLLEFEISPPGSAVKACTSAVISLVHGDYSCVGEMMDRSEYLDARHGYRETLGITAGSITSEMVADFKRKHPNENHECHLAAVRLEQLERAFSEFEGELGKSLTIPDARDGKTIAEALSSYAKHGSENPRQPLVTKLTVRLPTLRTPSYLELVDLPGNDQTNKADDRKWKTFLHEEADGVILFLPSNAGVDTHGLKELLEEINLAFEDSGNRIWLAVTKFCANPLDLIWGLGSYDPWVQKFREQFPDITDQNLIFLETQEESVSSLAARDKNSGPPPGISPDMQEAYQSLKEDGGIGYLKTVITDRLVEDVKKAVNQQVESLLDQVDRAIQTFRQEERLSALLGREEQQVIASWQTAISNAMRIVSQRGSQIRQDDAEKYDACLLEPQRKLTAQLIRELQQAYDRFEPFPPDQRADRFYHSVSDSLKHLLEISTEPSSDAVFTSSILKAVMGLILESVDQKEVKTNDEPYSLAQRLNEKLGLEALRKSTSWQNIQTIYRSIESRSLLEGNDRVVSNFDLDLLYTIFSNKIYQVTSRILLQLTTFIVRQLYDLDTDLETIITSSRRDRSINRQRRPSDESHSDGVANRRLDEEPVVREEESPVSRESDEDTPPSASDEFPSSDLEERRNFPGPEMSDDDLLELESTDQSGSELLDDDDLI